VYPVNPVVMIKEVPLLAKQLAFGRIKTTGDGWKFDWDKRARNPV
jgi:hypothetical protein